MRFLLFFGFLFVLILVTESKHKREKKNNLKKHGRTFGNDNVYRLFRQLQRPRSTFRSFCFRTAYPRFFLRRNIRKDLSNQRYKTYNYYWYFPHMRSYVHVLAICRRGCSYGRRCYECFICFQAPGHGFPNTVSTQKTTTSGSVTASVPTTPHLPTTRFQTTTQWTPVTTTPTTSSTTTTTTATTTSPTTTTSTKAPTTTTTTVPTTTTTPTTTSSTTVTTTTTTIPTTSTTTESTTVSSTTQSTTSTTTTAAPTSRCPATVDQRNIYNICSTSTSLDTEFYIDTFDATESVTSCQCILTSWVKATVEMVGFPSSTGSTCTSQIGIPKYSKSYQCSGSSGIFTVDPLGDMKVTFTKQANTRPSYCIKIVPTDYYALECKTL